VLPQEPDARDRAPVGRPVHRAIALGVHRIERGTTLDEERGHARDAFAQRQGEGIVTAGAVRPTGSLRRPGTLAVIVSLPSLTATCSGVPMSVSFGSTDNPFAFSHSMNATASSSRSGRRIANL
jgi:hypothetical protein